jgi:hypothetical protein
MKILRFALGSVSFDVKYFLLENVSMKSFSSLKTIYVGWLIQKNWEGGSSNNVFDDNSRNFGGIKREGVSREGKAQSLNGLQFGVITFCPHELQSLDTFPISVSQRD